MTHAQESKLGLSCSNKGNPWRTRKRAKQMGYLRYHSILAWDNLWLTVINVHLKKARQAVTHSEESKTGLLDGSHQGQLHGAKNSQENFASLPISITLFLLPRKTLSMSHDNIVTIHAHTAHTNNRSTYALFSWRGLPNSSYNTCQLKRGCWGRYSPPHPYVRTHSDLARLYDTDRSMRRIHGGDKPNAPIDIQHDELRDVPISPYCFYTSREMFLRMCNINRYPMTLTPTVRSVFAPTPLPPQTERRANKTRISPVLLSW